MSKLRKASKQITISDQLREEILASKINEKLPTERELAERFQCSTGTISKALALLVHEGLVERKPRGGTRVLRNRSSAGEKDLSFNAFAFICPNEQHEWLWKMLRGFQRRAKERGRRIVMLTSDLDAHKEMELITRLPELDVQGALVHPTVSTMDQLVQFAHVLDKVKQPIVMAGSTLGGLNRPSVIVDGFHAGYTVTRHMIEQGATRIGFLSNRAWSVSIRDRLQGYRWAMREAGLEIPARFVVLDTEIEPNFDDPNISPRKLAEQYLDRGATDEIEGVVCAYDLIAHGLLSALESRRIKVPDAFRVVGIDDYDQNNEKLGLSSYRVDFEALGQQAYDFLELIVDTADYTGSNEIQISGQMIVRRTA